MVCTVKVVGMHIPDYHPFMCAWSSTKTWRSETKENQENLMFFRSVLFVFLVPNNTKVEGLLSLLRNVQFSLLQCCIVRTGDHVYYNTTTTSTPTMPPVVTIGNLCTKNTHKMAYRWIPSGYIHLESKNLCTQAHPFRFWMSLFISFIYSKFSSEGIKFLQTSLS